MSATSLDGGFSTSSSSNFSGSTETGPHKRCTGVIVFEVTYENPDRPARLVPRKIGGLQREGLGAANSCRRAKF